MAQAPLHPTQSSVNILLIEDNEGDVELTQRAFKGGKPSCNISVANDGMEALDFLHKRGNFTGAPKVHLILLDLNMPRMDGKQFLENVKKRGRVQGHSDRHADQLAVAGGHPGLLRAPCQHLCRETVRLQGILRGRSPGGALLERSCTIAVGLHMNGKGVVIVGVVRNSIRSH